MRPTNHRACHVCVCVYMSVHVCHVQPTHPTNKTNKKQNQKQHGSRHNNNNTKNKVTQYSFGMAIPQDVRKLKTVMMVRCNLSDFKKTENN